MLPGAGACYCRHAGDAGCYRRAADPRGTIRCFFYFHFEDLPKIAALCKKQHVKTYLTVNTILYDHDIVLMKKICDAAKAAGIGCGSVKES